MPSLVRSIQRTSVLGVLLGLVAGPAAAQEAAGSQPAEELGQQPDQAVVDQVKPLYMLVNEVIASAAEGASMWKVDPSGKEQPTSATAPVQASVTSDFLRASDNQVYVPFLITLDSQAMSSPAVAVYVRAVAQGQSAAAGESRQGEEDESAAPAQTKFPFEDFYLGTLKAAGPSKPTVLTGYAQLPAGPYDLYVAVRERASDVTVPFQATVVKESLEVPNYFASELTTSSVLLVKQIDQLPSDPTPEQQHENPYTFGRNQLVLAPDGEFGQADQFNLLLFVYNFGRDVNQQPDITVEYQLFQRAGEAEKEFRKIEPQTYDASTVTSAADQLPVSLNFAVSALEAGDFRLVVKVTDNTSGKSLTRDASFTVLAS